MLQQFKQLVIWVVPLYEHTEAANTGKRRVSSWNLFLSLTLDVVLTNTWVRLPFPIITGQRLEKQTTPPPPVSCCQLYLSLTESGVVYQPTRKCKKNAVKSREPSPIKLQMKNRVNPGLCISLESPSWFYANAGVMRYKKLHLTYIALPQFLPQ